MTTVNKRTYKFKVIFYIFNQGFAFDNKLLRNGARIMQVRFNVHFSELKYEALWYFEGSCLTPLLIKITQVLNSLTTAPGLIKWRTNEWPKAPKAESCFGEIGLLINHYIWKRASPNSRLAPMAQRIRSQLQTLPDATLSWVTARSRYKNSQ